MSGLEVTLGCAGAAVLAAALLHRLAPRYGFLDVPNARSSHDRAVPRGGGLAIALPVLVTAVALTLLRRLPAAQALAWLGGGALVATVGLLDDREGLSVRARLIAQLLAALAVMCVWHPAPFAGLNQLGGWLQLATWLSGTIAVVWVINLFNFMDGIDGLAALQALFVCVAALWLGAGPPASPEGWLLFALAGAAAGFLVWNWAPARIFMGDVGSGFLGFALALAAVASSRDGFTSIWLWTILMAAFIADATVTLCVRAFRHERIHHAHRQHAYQRLARHWGSHARVCCAFLAVDLLWLLPLAMAAARRPRWAPWLTLAALGALVLLALLAGAGRSGDIGSRGSAAHGLRSERTGDPPAESQP